MHDTTTTDQAFTDALDALAAFVTDHSRTPSIKETSDGVRVGEWLATQRAQYRNGRLTGERATAITAIIPGSLDTLEDAWRARAADLERFIQVRHRTPLRNGRGEASLAIWLMNQQTAEKKGTLPAPRSERLAQILSQSGETLAKGAWSTTLSNLEAFVAANGRLPRRGSSDIVERRLADWVNTQRHRHNTVKNLTIDRINRLAAIPGWAWSAKEPSTVLNAGLA
ncbi:helicase associated domain-containing protein [Leifsonia sp. Leaf264]|uniref:helicase associated domain-containing protein n=1 Tax=Leifsonia sp. Leaf264 TaxID=1736314 RepID=UPI000701CB4E|nr:helicase associated domain-containing protein [Leifsonia sp. Leaf264]KQO98551.1 hypothetical protein ASF30_10845 [Leifsonia sp. Leaf264]